LTFEEEHFKKSKKVAKLKMKKVRKKNIFQKSYRSQARAKRCKKN